MTGSLDGTSHQQTAARVASRFHSKFLHHYVASKLRTDPVYPAIYQLIEGSAHPIMDAGCGVGLLAFYLRERGLENSVVGLDRDHRKIREANRIANAHYQGLTFQECDLRDELPPFSGHVAMLDLLHYLAPGDQEKLLQRMSQQVAPGAVLVLRECPRDGGARFWATCLAEKFAQGIRWNIATPLSFPSRETIQRSFQTEEFISETRPLWGRTPFNNHLFIFRRRPAARTAE